MHVYNINTTYSGNSEWKWVSWAVMNWRCGYWTKEFRRKIAGTYVHVYIKLFLNSAVPVALSHVSILHVHCMTITTCVREHSVAGLLVLGQAALSSGKWAWYRLLAHALTIRWYLAERISTCKTMTSQQWKWIVESWIEVRLKVSSPIW